MKDLQLDLHRAGGPMAYLAWRLCCDRSGPAIAVPSAIVFMDPIRPYSHATMIVMLPTAGGLPARAPPGARAVHPHHCPAGAGFGAAFGLLFLWYSGWFVWTAPGVLLLRSSSCRGAARRQPRRALLFLGATLLSAAVAGGTAAHPDGPARCGHQGPLRLHDDYIDPAYVIGWISDRKGRPTTTPSRSGRAGRTDRLHPLLLGAVASGSASACATSWSGPRRRA